MASNEGLVDLHSRHEFNLCPMCWMPLHIDRSESEDQKWGSVQFVFKGKPAFSVNSGDAKGNRHVYVFGVTELFAKEGSREKDGLIRNCEGCHFIHSFASKYTAEFRSWGTVADKQRLAPLHRGGNDDQHLNFFENLHVEYGLIDGVSDFVASDYTKKRMEYFTQNRVFETLSNVFSGCKDCNQKMTLSDYIFGFFDLYVPNYNEDTQKKRKGADDAQPKTDRGRKMDKETQMYYILLSGMIRKEQLIPPGTDGNNYFKISVSEGDQLTWPFRYVILWCLYQILFAEWADGELKLEFRHHLSYIYGGIKDFYLSLLFFAMYGANGYQIYGGCALKFEVFHFFYASHLPFFINSEKKDSGFKHRSLYDAVMGDEKLKFSKERVEIRRQFKSLKDHILQFWNEHFHPLCDFIIGNKTPKYQSFFCDPGSAVEMSVNCVGKNLNIQTFKDYFTSYPGYWFHFKNITMPKIEKDCLLYYRRNPVDFTKRAWVQWYAYLCMCIRELDNNNAPAVPAQRVVRSHLTARVLRSLVPEGGRRWCVRVVG